MRVKILSLACFGGAVLCLGSMAIKGQSSNESAPQPIAASIDVQQTSEPVSKYEFGMFIEHIGALIYRSLWSEMLDDRKFLMISAVNATDNEQRADLRVAGARVSGPFTLWQLTGESLESSDHAGAPPQVEVKETAIGEAQKTLTVAPISVNVYRFSVVPSAE